MHIESFIGTALLVYFVKHAGLFGSTFHVSSDSMRVTLSCVDDMAGISASHRQMANGLTATFL